jgi:predicted esterase
MISIHRHLMRLMIVALTCLLIFPKTASGDELDKAKGFWGINYKEPDTEDKQGIVLTYILARGPADRAGLKLNDMILEINGQEITMEKFEDLSDQYKVDDELVLLVMRADKKFTTDIVLGNRDIEMQPKGFERHFIEMKSLGTYIVMLPPDYEGSGKDYPLCMILHGRGSTEIAHGRLADILGRDSVIYIAPRYSYPFVPVFIEHDQEGWSGYPPYDFGEDHSFNPVIESLSIEWYFSCVADAKERYRIADDKIYIFGHSQGAFFSLACAGLHPDIVASCFAFAPYVPDFLISEQALAGMKKQGVKVYLAHGIDDQVLDIKESESAEKAMKQADVDCVFKKFKAGHGFTEEIYSFAREWLDAEIRGH